MDKQGLDGKDIHVVLSEIQQDLNVSKDKTNSFGGYKYRTCESILKALKPLLKPHDASVYMSDDVKEVGGKNYLMATVYFAAYGQVQSVCAYAREAESKKGMDDAQVTGACSSYARKYALCGLFGIDDGNDLDSKDHSDIGRSTQGARPLFGDPVSDLAQDQPLIVNNASLPVQIEQSTLQVDQSLLKNQNAQEVVVGNNGSTSQFRQEGTAEVESQLPQGGSPKDKLQDILMNKNAFEPCKQWLIKGNFIADNQEWCDAPMNVITRAVDNPERFLQAIGVA